MKYILLLTFMFSIANANQKPIIEEAVARDLESMVGETVNEGDQTAELIYVEGKPLSTCKISEVEGKANKRWAFCRVDFLVKHEDLEAERQCAVLYSFDTRRPVSSLQRGDRSFFQKCVENLGESIE